MRTRIAIVVSAVVVASVLAGCAGYSAPMAVKGSTGGAETTATPDHYAATRTSAGLALGVELQRTADARLAGKAWAMSVTGKADLAGARPAVTLWAIGTDGSRRVLKAVEADGADGISTVQGTFVVPIPPKTARIAATTTLRSTGATEPAPAFTIPIGDITQVERLTLVP